MALGGPTQRLCVVMLKSDIAALRRLAKQQNHYGVSALVRRAVIVYLRAAQAAEAAERAAKTKDKP